MAVVQTYLVIILIFLFLLLAIGPRLGSVHKRLAIVAVLVAAAELLYGVLFVLIPVLGVLMIDYVRFLVFQVVIAFQALGFLTLLAITNEAIQKKGMTCNLDNAYIIHIFYSIYFVSLFYFKSILLIPII